MPQHFCGPGKLLSHGSQEPIPVFIRLGGNHLNLLNHPASLWTSIFSLEMPPPRPKENGKILPQPISGNLPLCPVMDGREITRRKESVKEEARTRKGTGSEPIH